jgi:hypothetical protein
MNVKWKIGSALRAGFKYSLLASLGAVSCAARLTPEELQKVDDFESIHGFTSARLFFNLVGSDEGTLPLVVGREIGPFGLWITAQDSLARIYEGFSVSDPVAGSGKKFGEVNYLNYRVGFSSFSLVPSDAGEAGYPRPFEINTPGVTRFISLANQRQIKGAAIAFNDRFCSPANLETLGGAAAEILEAFSSNFDQGQIFRLFQNFAYQHILYIAGRLSGSVTQTQMQTAAFVISLLQGYGGLSNFIGTDPSQLHYALRPFHVFFTGSLLAAGSTGLIPQDHSREFAPHIIALFNLVQSWKVLSTFLGAHPLSVLKGLMRDEADTSARGLISTYEIMVAETIEYMKNLDNSLYDLLPHR